MTPTDNIKCLGISKTILGVFIKDAIKEDPEINCVSSIFLMKQQFVVTHRKAVLQ